MHEPVHAIFTPAFLLPLAPVAVGLVAYWREFGGSRVTLADLRHATVSTGKLRNLSGGQGQGCNFEKEDRYSDRRRVYHRLTLYGFLLCIASTSSGTILHYVFDSSAPYDLFLLPKLFGVSGGIMLTIGALRLAWLKTQADPTLGKPDIGGGQTGFVLLALVGLSGLVLYAATGTEAVPVLLALHLGGVLAFFLLIPYSKMAHGFYRFAVLVRDAQHARGL